MRDDPDVFALFEKTTAEVAAAGRARGNRLELPWLAGKVVALGREVGVPTPTFDVMYAALKPYANGGLCP